MKKMNCRIVYRDLRACKRLALKRLYLIILISVFWVAAGLCMFTVSASDDVTEGRFKYYTSVEISDDDNLWDICDDYISDEYKDKNDMIREIKKLNHLSDDNIKAGESIIIPYYSSKVK